MANHGLNASSAQFSLKSSNFGKLKKLETTKGLFQKVFKLIYVKILFICIFLYIGKTYHVSAKPATYAISFFKMEIFMVKNLSSFGF